MQTRSVQPLSAQLAAFVADTRYQDIPFAAREKAKSCLLDAIGVSLAASGIGAACRTFVDLAIEQGGVPRCTILGSAHRVPAEAAAFANGALAHALDYEDSHDGALIHPNAPAVPAALAIAQAYGPTPGSDLITAVAVGCDVAVRLALSLRVALADYGWYPPPILGAFAATAAAAKLLRLPAQQVRDAFSLTLCQATCSGEIIYSPSSSVREVRDAFPARAAVTAALLAQRGVRGFDAPFEGRAGFFAMFARGAYEPGDIVRELGKHFEIENISFKPWPSCRGTHAAIEAALQCRRDHDIQPAHIEHVQVRGGRMLKMLAEPLASKRRPATAIDAKFSLPFTVATALVRGRVELQDFLPQAIGNEDVLRLAEKVHVDATDECRSEVRPAAVGAQLTVRLRDGRAFHQSVETPRGSPARPLDPQALVEKFIDCAARAATPLDASAARRFAATTASLEKVMDIDREWLDLLAIQVAYRR